ncbi:MAG: exodeoxyribonuclease V subunit gamma [Deltaproteobacteria bacterium]|nr:exodeoxyribonuclease V subunit gamma [Deltaproteobacteria bacterium]
MGINLFSGNKLSILSEALSKVISQPLSKPFVKEIFIVQSKGMERYINLALARSHGIAANISFMFPNQLVNELFLKLPENPDLAFYDKNVLTFKIMDLLSGSLVENEEFAQIKSYINSSNSELKKFQISHQIADIFDQYLLYRPLMIKQWEKGGANHWQATLFREILNHTEIPHRIDLLVEFKKIIPNADLHGEGFERINIFGISSLPQYHMEMVSALSDYIPVNFFALNPCREYWGDQLSDKEIYHARKKSNTSLDIHVEQGNSLLSSMGKSGRDFFDMLNQFSTNDYNLFDSYEVNSLLSSIKNDIVNFNETPYSVDISDNSISFHACHSESREVEILQDNILSFLDSEGINPEDIIVMAPDIEKYTPYIHSVFNIDKLSDKIKIPYSISDRTVISESRLIDAFMNILNLSSTRMEASVIISLLEVNEIMERFELTDKDLDIIRKWVKESGIRWGVDAKYREQEGLPSYNAFSWDHGLKRMLTGYAMPGDNEKMFMDILPYDPIEGGFSEILGKLSSFTKKLFGTVEIFKEKHSVIDWVEVLKDILESFLIRSDETEREFKMAIDTFNELTEFSEIASFNNEISIKIIMNYLSKSFSKKGFGGGFISSGITFCSMLPMRSIPFKVICLLGMNDNEFPASTFFSEFDLIGKYPKKGDRSKRDDDRYLLLETIMSANEKLYISYIGQSIKDNSNIPPSVVVTELLDYIEKKCSDKEIINNLILRHPLQPFSLEYFKGDKLFSYSKEYYQSALSLTKEKKPLIFAKKPINDAPKEFKDINLSNLLSFFSNPSKYLLKNRVGINIQDNYLKLEDREPFDIAPLEAHILEKTVFEKIISDVDPMEYLKSAKFSGNTPVGSPGEYMIDEMFRKVSEISDKIKDYIKISSDKTEYKLDISMGEFRVTGYLEKIFNKMIHFRYGKTRGKERLLAWIKHLFLNTLEEGPNESLLLELSINKNRRWDLALIDFGQIDDPRPYIMTLLNIYWNGLRSPLHFFPDSSYEYSSLLFEKGKDSDYAVKKSKERYHGSNFNAGEKKFDSYGDICFRNYDPIDSQFEDLAVKIFEPYFKYSTKSKV